MEYAPHFRLPLRRKDGSVVAWALVSEADRELAETRTWRLSNLGYAIRSDGKNRSALLHRKIKGCERGDGRFVDHINRDRLDNRRENLRVLTAATNSQNQGAATNSTSKYRGVSWYKQSKQWEAGVRFDGRYRYLGRYENETDAAKAAAKFRAEHMAFAVEDPELLR